MIELFDDTLNSFLSLQSKVYNLIHNKNLVIINQIYQS